MKELKKNDVEAAERCLNEHRAYISDLYLCSCYATELT